MPLVLSTDDAGVSRIDLTNEYFRAARDYRLGYRDLKAIARNSLTYSFLADKDKRDALARFDASVAEFERAVADEGQSVPKAHLKLSGIVCAEDGALRVRNRIYREVFDERWVRKHNPPNWTKRLTRAAAALVVAVLFLMLPVGVFALYQW
ncbi:MAG: hypothetical protein ABR562_10010, partial [Thermoplasmatota archaeon]